MTKRFKFVAVLAITGSLAAGCGGDDDEADNQPVADDVGTSASGETGAAGLLPADFIAEADALCAAANEEVQARFTDLGANPEPKQLEAAVSDIVVPKARELTDSIRDLGDPEEGAEELTEFLDGADAVTDTIEDDPSVYSEGVSAGENPYEEVNKQAAESRPQSL